MFKTKTAPRITTAYKEDSILADVTSATGSAASSATGTFTAVVMATGGIGLAIGAYEDEIRQKSAHIRNCGRKLFSTSSLEAAADPHDECNEGNILEMEMKPPLSVRC